MTLGEIYDLKRILQIVCYYYPHIGGIEQVARDIANVIRDEEGFEQKIICFNETAQDGDYKCLRKDTVNETVDGIDVVRCGCITKKASQSISLTFARELKKIMKGFRPDIVIFHYPNPLEAHYLLRYISKNCRLIIYWHLDITKQKMLKHLFKHQNLSLINRADYIIGATPIHLDTSEFSHCFGEKKRVLPYMIDEDIQNLSDKELGLANMIREKYRGQVLALFVGRHVSYKGLTYLIDASKELGNASLKILIAGEGELTNQLKSQAEGDDKIIFIGKLSQSEKKSYYKACDIICFPSITRNEGFGLALAEGMSFGKPAVTFSIYGSGVNYVNLSDVTGIECPNSDSKAYASALKLLVEDEILRKKMGKSAKNHIENNFTKRQFKMNVLKLLKEF